MNDDVEVPVSEEMDIQPGAVVVVATRQGRNSTYQYAQVSHVSGKLKLLTVGSDRYTQDGYLYTSDTRERYSKRLLLPHPALDDVIHRQDLLDNLNLVRWEVEKTEVLEAVWRLLQAQG